MKKARKQKKNVRVHLLNGGEPQKQSYINKKERKEKPVGKVFPKQKQKFF